LLIELGIEVLASTVPVANPGSLQSRDKHRRSSWTRDGAFPEDFKVMDSEMVETVD